MLTFYHSSLKIHNLFFFTEHTKEKEGKNPAALKDKGKDTEKNVILVLKQIDTQRRMKILT